MTLHNKIGWYRHTSRLLLAGLLLTLLAACTLSNRRAPATPVAVDLSGWRELYRRDGWAGGPAVDLRAVGDVMLGRVIATLGRRRGFDYPFSEARQLLGDAGGATLAVGNLESPLTDRPGPLRPGPYRLPAPTAFAAPLRAAGFQALTLANNHALDAGPAGLSDAAAALRAAGIETLGVGKDAQAARAPTIVTVGGLRVALLGLNDVGDPEDRPDEGQGDPASRAAWGRAWLNEDALQNIRRARDRADLVVVLVHWGREYQAHPTDRQREWARRLVGAGADLVVGAHPHVVQPAELVTADGRAGFVAYSLGNFIFDQSDNASTSTGAALRVLLDRAGVAQVAAAPVAIASGQARPLPLDDARALATIATLMGKPDSPTPLPAAAGAGEQAPDEATAAASEAEQTASTHPTPMSAAADLSAWSWDGGAAREVPIPAGTRLAARARRLPVDLRGDGRPLWASLDERGMVELRDGPDAASPVVWRNEAADWRVTRIDAGDLDGDGRIELLLLLWRHEEDGRLGSHPFLVGWRGGRYRVLWGGSATATYMQDVAVADLDGDGRQELVVLEGGQAPGEPAETASIWRWSGWMFELAWRSAPRRLGALAIQDLDGDGRPEIVAATNAER